MNKMVVAIALVLALTGWMRKASAENYPADNTGKNVRDRGGDTLTSGNQSGSKPDMRITQTIRKAIVADKTLSTDAHNVKIITVDGVVTLRGPVKSTAEKSRIAAKAKHVAGVRRVDNQLEVASH